MCFQMPEKDFGPDVFSQILSGKLPLFHKIYVTLEVAVSHDVVILSTAYRHGTLLVIVKDQSSQHMHNITNLSKVKLNWSSKLRDNYEKTHPCHTTLCAL